MQPFLQKKQPARSRFPTISSHVKKIVFLYVFMSLLIPFVVGFFVSVLEEIEVPAIRKMAIREEEGTYFLDAIVTIRNTSQKTLKFVDCTFQLAVVSQKLGDIRLGDVSFPEILLDQEGDATNTDTDIMFSIELGSEKDLQTLYHKLTSTSALLVLDATPQISLHLQARFHLALKSSQAWHYSNGVEIDWIVTPEVERTVLIEFLQAISGGEFIAPTPVPATPTPGATPPPAQDEQQSL